MRKGFTLVELLIVLAIIGGILVLALNAMGPRGVYRISSMDDDLPFMKIFLDRYLRFVREAEATIEDDKFIIDATSGSFGSSVSVRVEFENIEQPRGLRMTVNVNGVEELQKFFRNVSINTSESTAGNYIRLRFATPGGTYELFYPVSSR